MKKIYLKLANAKEFIKNTKHKKAGRNTYSNYDYFTPAQIEQLVYEACSKQGLLTNFNLVRNDLGVQGILSIIDIDSGEEIEFEMATAIPEIKATNIAQQLGGCVTYTERYLKMTAFGITDNNLDFDNNKTEKSLAKEPVTKNVTKPNLKPNTAEWENVRKALGNGYTWNQVKEKYKVSVGHQAQMEKELNNPQIA